MIQQLLALLPGEITTIGLILAVAGAFVGGVLWLGGSRFSRTLVTLSCVFAGTLIGLRLPQWLGWGLEGWATALLGALVLGLSGYLLHKFWVGVGLGLVLATWAALATFALCSDGKEWAWPAKVEGTLAADYLTAVWNSFTPEVRRIGPFLCCAAALSGLAASIIWPRLGVVLLYSSMGISLLIGLGVLAMNAAKKEWLAIIPGKTSSQLIVLAAAVAFGAILQWRTAPGAPRAPRPAHD